MFGVTFSLRFAWLAGVFFLVWAAAAIGGYRCFKNGRMPSLVPAVLFQATLFFLWGKFTGIDVDEVEHLHCAWLTAQGLVAFRDFWQHHSPAVWLSLAPLMRFVEPSAQIFTYSRLLAGGIFFLNGAIAWMISRGIWGRRADARMFFLLLSSAAIIGEFLWLRPDIFMHFWLLCGVYWALQTLSGRRFAFLLSGLCFGMAAAFSSKQYLLYALPLVLSVRCVSARERLFRAGSYLAGLAAGVMPLFLYLARQGLVREFLHWTVASNRERLVLSVQFPLGLALLCVWGFVVFLRQCAGASVPQKLFFLSFLLLTTLSSLTGSIFQAGGYYLGFWYFAAIIAGSGLRLTDILPAAASLRSRAILFGAVIAVISGPGINAVYRYRTNNLNHDTRVLAQVMRWCGPQDTALVLLPYHPVFSFDATRLYSYWQFIFAGRVKDVTADIVGARFAAQVLGHPPAIIQHQVNGRSFLYELVAKGLITNADFTRLRSLILERYTVQRVGREWFYVRRDKLEAGHKTHETGHR